MTKSEVIAKPGTQEIIMTRIFNAPRELVFKAVTDPALVPNWWGPKDYTTIVDKMDVKPGGVWRFVQRSADGSEYGFYGVFHAINAPERFVQTFEFEGMPGHVLLETMTFEELPDGKTKLIDLSVFQSVEDRDGMLNSGMQQGADESWDRLDEILKTS
jgi:uncharacterized protein YndB with AHSA1/START domain